MSRGRVSPGEALRNSGLPLEFAASSILAGVQGLQPHGRYFYERDGKTCETDLSATQSATHRFHEREVDITHTLFFECEHRTERKHWCFLPPAKNVVDDSKNAVFIDFIPDVRHFDKSKLRILESEFYVDASVVGDATELYEDGKGQWSSNTQAISNAIRQVTMPIGTVLPLSYLITSSCDWKKKGAIQFFTPIIVTTARIQVLQNGIDWADLSQCSEIEDCFEEKQNVFSVFVTPTYIENYWRERMRETLKSAPKRILLKILAESGDRYDEVTIDAIANMAVDDRPTRVLIVQFDALKVVMERYLGAVREEISSCLELAT
jgi:hypothetical protein